MAWAACTDPVCDVTTAIAVMPRMASNVKERFSLMKSQHQNFRAGKAGENADLKRKTGRPMRARAFHQLSYIRTCHRAS